MLDQMNKPFIKLFKSPHSNYFYDVNRNEIVSVDEDVYDYLKNLLKDIKQNPNYEVKGKIKLFEERGYLSQNIVKNIKHPMTDYLEVMLERNVQKITLQLTQKCNFRCSYCPYTQNKGSQRKHSDARMTLETAKKAVLFLRDRSIDTNIVNVGFYGGEPLLELDMIRSIVDFCKEALKGKNVTYTVTTNASLLTEEACRLFSENKFGITISLDGNEKINDQNRVFAESGKGTYQTVINKIDMIYDKFPSLRKGISVNMVVNPINDVDEICEVYDLCKKYKDLKIVSSSLDNSFDDSEIIYNKDFISKFEYCLFLSYLNNFRGINDNSKIKFSNHIVSKYKDDFEKLGN